MKPWGIGVACAYLVLLGSPVGLGGCGPEEFVSCPSGRIRCRSRCIDPPEATLSHLQETVFTPVCAINRCHGPLDTQEELLLTSAEETHMNLVNHASLQRPEAILVVPGSPEQSYLMNKLRGQDMEAFSSIGEETFQMPRQGGLCEEQVLAIEEWIRQGAQPN